MKRLLLMLAVAATAALGIFAGTAASTDVTLTLAFTQTSVSAGGTITFTGTLTGAPAPPSVYRQVYVTFWPDATCSADWLLNSGPAVADDVTGEYSLDATVPATWTPGPVWVRATTWGTPPLAVSACMPLTIAAPVAKAAVAPPPNGVFLCYSAYQDQPGVWPEAQAKALLASGYWYPYAVAGGTSGTAIGGYGLTCNIAATQSVSTSFIGGDGTLVGAAYSGTFGFYPVVGK